MENLSLFDLQDTPEEKELVKAVGHKLDVIRMSFEEAETMTWQELFSGWFCHNSSRGRNHPGWYGYNAGRS